MPYEFHDTSHVQTRARERGFSVEQAKLTINEPGSILKTPSRRGIMAECFGCSSAYLSVGS